MIDIIEALRHPMWVHSKAPFESPQLDKEENVAAMKAAAVEIERLRKALQWISDQHDCDPGAVKAADVCLVAKNALSVPSFCYGGRAHSRLP